MFLSRIKTLLIVGVLLFCGTASAGWWKTFGDEGAEVAYCVQQTEDGGYIITGENNSYSWLIKTDSLGNHLWDNSYGGNGLSRWVEETNDGGYVTTATYGLLKVNAQGDSLWRYMYGIRSQCVDKTSDGGYIITGTYGYGEQMALIKTGHQGDTLWTKGYKIPNWDYTFAYFVRETNDKGFIVTGQVADSNGTFLQYNSTLLLVKIDSLGDTLWVRIYDSIKGSGSCVRQTSDQGYIVTGSFGLLKTDPLGEILWAKTYSFNEFSTVQQTIDGGYILTGREDYNLFLFKTDEWGDSIWARIYGEEGDELGFCAHQTSDSGYIVTGYTTSFGVDGSVDIWLLKTDSLGLLAIEEEPIPMETKNWKVVPSLGSYIMLSYSDRPQGLHVNIFDATGRRIDEMHGSGGSGTLSWGEGFPAGVYFIQVQEKNNGTSTAKAVLVR